METQVENGWFMRKRLPRLPESPAASTLSTRRSMKGNRSKGTLPEATLAEALNARGLSEYMINYSDLPGSPDFVFPIERVAIFVNGCYWHRCPHCMPHFPNINEGYWSAKFQRNRRRDMQNRADLRAMGWIPLVVWECILRKNPKAVGARIHRRLQKAHG